MIKIASKLSKEAQEVVEGMVHHCLDNSIAMGIAIGVAVYEGVVWWGKSSLAPVLIALAVAMVCQSAYLISIKRA